MDIINKGTLFLFIMGSLVTIGASFFELSQPYTSPEDAQSRFEFHLPLLLTICLIGATIVIIYFRKKLKLFDGPLFLLLGGFWYLWVFRTFTTGWIMLQGFLGFILALLIFIFLTLYQWMVYVKQKRKHTS